MRGTSRLRRPRRPRAGEVVDATGEERCLCIDDERRASTAATRRPRPSSSRSPKRTRSTTASPQIRRRQPRPRLDPAARLYEGRARHGDGLCNTRPLHQLRQHGAAALAHREWRSGRGCCSHTRGMAQRTRMLLSLPVSLVLVWSNRAGP